MMIRFLEGFSGSFDSLAALRAEPPAEVSVKLYLSAPFAEGLKKPVPQDESLRYSSTGRQATCKSSREQHWDGRAA